MSAALGLRLQLKPCCMQWAFTILHASLQGLVSCSRFRPVCRVQGSKKLLKELCVDVLYECSG